MSEERSPLVRTDNEYGSIDTGPSISSAPNDTSDIQVDPAATTSDVQNSPPANTTTEDQMRSTLSSATKIGYGLGHVYNDLCAGVWFSYTLLFLQGALLVPSAEAGALMMLGQVGDAIATPFVGFLADRYGTKRKWHAFGTN